MCVSGLYVAMKAFTRENVGVKIWYRKNSYII